MLSTIVFRPLSVVVALVQAEISQRNKHDKAMVLSAGVRIDPNAKKAAKMSEPYTL